MPKYAIAVKRAKRDEMTLGQALEKIHEIPEVEIVGDPRQGSLTINATDRAIVQVVARLKYWCHIEAEIRHFPLGGTRAGLLSKESSTPGLA